MHADPKLLHPRYDRVIILNLMGTPRKADLVKEKALKNYSYKEPLHVVSLTPRQDIMDPENCTSE
jgi:hypothetical protein